VPSGKSGVLWHWLPDMSCIFQFIFR
jgi:hypothetical protein